MKPIAALPMHDPDGLLFPRLRAITPDLKELFETVFVSVPPATRQNLPRELAWLQSEPFYQAIYFEEAISVGDDFLTLYQTAARATSPGQIIHLCYIDRLAFALQTGFRQQIIADIEALQPEQTPMIFERSPSAWLSHPANYYEIESMVSTAADVLLGRSLDYCWCHFAIQAGQLLQIIPTIKRRDIAHVAEYILPIRNEIHARPVDWLAWEDPFILGRDPQELKQEREQSVIETHKRLSYAIPMLQMLQQTAAAD